MTVETKKHSSKRLMVAGGSLLAIAGLITAASFTDFANLNLGNGTDDSGIGGANRFNIQVVDTDADGNPVLGTWQEADTAEGVNINIPNADAIAPGDSVSVVIPFRNESPMLSADISFSLQDRPGHTSDPEIADALLYTITLDGVTVRDQVTQDGVSDVDLGRYLTDENGELGIKVTLPSTGNEAGDNAFQGQVSYVQAHFDAISVQP